MSSTKEDLIMKPITKLILIIGLVSSLSSSKPAHPARAAQSPPEDPAIEAHERDEDMNSIANVFGWSKISPENQSQPVVD